ASRRLLAHLVRRDTALPALTVITYRTEELIDADNLDALELELPSNTVLRLDVGGLDDTETAELVAAVRGGPERTLAPELFERTAGNPSFLEEILGHLDAGEDGSVVTEAIAD